MAFFKRWEEEHLDLEDNIEDAQKKRDLQNRLKLLEAELRLLEQRHGDQKKKKIINLGEIFSP